MVNYEQPVEYKVNTIDNEWHALCAEVLMFHNLALRSYKFQQYYQPVYMYNVSPLMGLFSSGTTLACKYNCLFMLPTSRGIYFFNLCVYAKRHMHLSCKISY